MWPLLSATLDLDRPLPVPPPMPRREIAQRAEAWPGTSVDIKEGDKTYKLFIPDKWKPGKDVTLTVNFHSIWWHSSQEHADRGLANPLLTVSVGAGSRVYEALFVNGQKLERWFPMVLAELRKKGAPDDARITAVDISSFSAGYGAVREILKDPEAFRLVTRVVLCDSLYGDLDRTKPGRVPDPTDIDVWVPLARAAIEGKKTFCLTVSEVPTDYASSWECAAAIAKAVGGELKPVERGSCSATLDREFPLLARFDQGNLHIWGYKGNDAAAHMTHVRHLADVWMALDRTKRP